MNNNYYELLLALVIHDQSNVEFMSSLNIFLKFQLTLVARATLVARVVVILISIINN